jgi:hypothetical protein
MPILLFVLQFVFRLIILIFGKIKEKIYLHHQNLPLLSFFCVFSEVDAGIMHHVRAVYTIYYI